MSGNIPGYTLNSSLTLFSGNSLSKGGATPQNTPQPSEKKTLESPRQSPTHDLPISPPRGTFSPLTTTPPRPPAEKNTDTDEPYDYLGIASFGVTVNSDSNNPLGLFDESNDDGETDSTQKGQGLEEDPASLSIAQRLFSQNHEPYDSDSVPDLKTPEETPRDDASTVTMSSVPNLITPPRNFLSTKGTEELKDDSDDNKSDGSVSVGHRSQSSSLIFSERTESSTEVQIAESKDGSGSYVRSRTSSEASTHSSNSQKTTVTVASKTGSAIVDLGDDSSTQSSGAGKGEPVQVVQTDTTDPSETQKPTSNDAPSTPGRRGFSSIFRFGQRTPRHATTPSQTPTETTQKKSSRFQLFGSSKSTSSKQDHDSGTPEASSGTTPKQTGRFRLFGASNSTSIKQEDKAAEDQTGSTSSKKASTSRFWGSSKSASVKKEHTSYQSSVFEFDRQSDIIETSSKQTPPDSSAEDKPSSSQNRATSVIDFKQDDDDTIHRNLDMGYDSDDATAKEYAVTPTSLFKGNGSFLAEVPPYFTLGTLGGAENTHGMQTHFNDIQELADSQEGRLTHSQELQFASRIEEQLYGNTREVMLQLLDTIHLITEEKAENKLASAIYHKQLGEDPDVTEKLAENLPRFNSHSAQVILSLAIPQYIGAPPLSRTGIAMLRNLPPFDSSHARDNIRAVLEPRLKSSASATFMYYSNLARLTRGTDDSRFFMNQGPEVTATIFQARQNYFENIKFSFDNGKKLKDITFLSGPSGGFYRFGYMQSKKEDIVPQLKADFKLPETSTILDTMFEEGHFYTLGRRHEDILVTYDLGTSGEKTSQAVTKFDNWISSWENSTPIKDASLINNVAVYRFREQEDSESIDDWGNNCFTQIDITNLEALSDTDYESLPTYLKFALEPIDAPSMTEDGRSEVEQ